MTEDLRSLERHIRNLRGGPGIHVHNASDGITISARPQAKQTFLARIMTEGPNGEDNYTDERYWVKEIACNLQEGDLTSRLTFAEREARVRWVTASDLAQKANESHLELEGSLVRIWSLYDAQQRPRRHYIFDGVGLGGAGSEVPDAPYHTIGSIDESETARTDSWDRENPPADTKGLQDTRIVRLAYDHTSDEILYAFYRIYTYDSVGCLERVTIETRVTIDAPEACP